jgi:CheY-like chemotaxis protein
MAEDRSSPPKRSSLPSEAKKRDKRLVMVLDDSPICLESLRISLEEGGYEVVTLDSPFGFAAALQQHAPDLVLVDVTMPGLQGDKLVEIALKNGIRSKTVIVLHSDRSETELSSLSVQCGAAGYIRKTSNDAELLRSIAQFLR